MSHGGRPLLKLGLDSKPIKNHSFNDIVTAYVTFYKFSQKLIFAWVDTLKNDLSQIAYQPAKCLFPKITKTTEENDLERHCHRSMCD